MLKNKKSQLEALLFVVGDEGIGLEELGYLLTLKTSETYDLVQQLQKDYQENPAAALNILEVGNHFVLTTKAEFAPLLTKYAQSPLSNRLSQAALETLAIIAYKQPLTRMEVDEIRGVHSSGSVQKLVARQLIEEKGRVEGPGRAILYGTTQYFMDYFGLKNLNELPDIQDLENQMEEELPFDLFFDRYQTEVMAPETDQAANEISSSQEIDNSADLEDSELTEVKFLSGNEEE